MIQDDYAVDWFYDFKLKFWEKLKMFIVDPSAVELTRYWFYDSKFKYWEKVVHFDSGWFYGF